MDNSAATRPHTEAKAVFCGPAPLIPGEDAAAYEDLLARVTSLVAPGDVLEELWVHDVVNRLWDIARLHRMKANLIAASAAEGLEHVLGNLGWGVPILAAREWARRDEATVAAVEKGLAGAGLSMDAVMARTFAVRIAEIDRIDRMIMAAEACRNAALHEVERHRSGFGQRLREAIEARPSEADTVAALDAPAVSPA